MKRTATAAALVLLALPAAAAAKGPHASIDPGPAGLRPGERWTATLTLVELRDPPATPPTVLFRSGSRRFAVRPAPIDSYDPPDMAAMAEARYRVRAAFPSAGRWSYTVVDAERRFRFPAVTIGNGAARVRTGYVAFAVGSRAEREGGGGAIMEDMPTAPPGGDALPPEVVLPPEEDEDGGVAPWLPAAGLALAGAAAVGWRRRR
jgi:hypothetical protein